MSHSVAVERESGKIQHLFITKTLRKLKLEGDFLNLTNRTYEKPTSNIILDGKNLNISLLHLGKRQGFLLTTFVFFSFQNCMEVLPSAIRQEKKRHIIRMNANILFRDNMSVCVEMENTG